jgi:hypothetical protein
MTMIKHMIAGTAAVLALVACGAAAATNAAATTPAVRAPTTFVASTSAEPTRLARYSATTGSLLTYLTAPAPGGGVGTAELSANGRTLLFDRFRGTCAVTVDTVPARGGAEQVLIPIIGSGMAAIIPDGASISADGRYLLYSMTPCANLAHHSVYLRNLRTGRTVRLARRGPLLDVTGAFINRDRQVAYASDGRLAVLNLRPLRLRFHAAPRGCSFGPLATPGTGSLLTGTLDCGRLVKVVTISASSFRVTGTIASLHGSCLKAASFSIAQHDPQALLLEVTGCRGTERILAVRDGRTTVLLSGPSLQMPQGPVW